jgi:hypothetical protein
MLIDHWDKNKNVLKSVLKFWNLLKKQKESLQIMYITIWYINIWCCFYFHKQLDTSSSVDWTLRHGRGTALSIAIKEAPDKIWTGRSDNVRKTVISLTEADRVSIGSIYFSTQHI